MIYTFHRADGFYPIELVNDIEAAHHVLFNPGTIKVVNEETEKVIYEQCIECETIGCSRCSEHCHEIP